MIKSNLILAEWVTHKLENNYITEVLPQESSEPQIRLPSLGTRRHEIIRLSKPVAFGHRNFIGLRETEAEKGETVPDSLPATPKSPPTRRGPPRGTPRDFISVTL